MSSLQAIFVFALVLSAVVSVGVAWITSRLAARLTRLELRVDRMRLGFATLSQKLDKLNETSTPALTLARIDDLTAAVDARHASLRRELGRLWARVGKDTPGTTETNGRGVPDDAEFQAMLELQNAHGSN